jgi:hypothetical protein
LVQSVQLAEAGQFQATVMVPMNHSGPTPVVGAEVSLFGAQGVVHRGTSDQLGEVTIPGVQPGVYALVSRSERLFACFAMRVLEADASGDQAYPESALISCALVAPPQFEATVAPYLSTFASREQLRIDPTTWVHHVDANSSTASHRVLRSDDGLVGTLRTAGQRPAGQMNVFLIKDRKRVARTTSDDSGRFKIEGVQSGVYSIVAVGPEGVAAIGFEVMDRSPAAVTAEGRRLISQVDPMIHTELVVDCIPMSHQEVEVVGCCEPQSSVAMQPEFVDEYGHPIADSGSLDCCGTPLAGGGYAPGGGYAGGGGVGGSGGGGFGVGGGDLAGLAAIGIAAGAIAATNDDNNFVPLPTSPVMPAN